MASISFNIYIDTTKSFNIALKGFTPSDSWFVLLSQIITVDWGMSLSKQLSIVLSQAMNFVFPMSFTEMVNVTFSQTNQAVFSMYVGGGFDITMSMTSVLNALGSLRYKVGTTISDFDFDISLTPILAQFFSLGDWDSDTLGTMDVEVLEDLDLTAI